MNEKYTKEDLQLFEYLQWTPPISKPIINESQKEEKQEKKECRHCEIIHEESGKCKVEIIDDLESEFDNYPEVGGKWFFDQTALQEYLLLCCQSEKGGLIDKPGKYVCKNLKLIHRSRDLYHTCYVLSGLSLAQNNPGGVKSVLGDPKNELVI